MALPQETFRTIPKTHPYKTEPHWFLFCLSVLVSWSSGRSLNSLFVIVFVWFNVHSWSNATFKEDNHKKVRWQGGSMLSEFCTCKCCVGFLAKVFGFLFFALRFLRGSARKASGCVGDSVQKGKRPRERWSTQRSRLHNHLSEKISLLETGR